MTAPLPCGWTPDPARAANPLPDTLTRRNTMPEQTLPFVLVELLIDGDDTDDHQFRIRSGNTVETADERASLLAGALYAVLARGNVGPEWSDIVEAIRSMPDVGDDAPDRPTVTVLCGSTRFYEAFQQANYDLTMAGEIVLSVGFYPHAKAEHGHGEGVGHDSTEKIALDELHKRKIDLADRVLVLDVGGYIGESTRGEIAYAEQLGKPVAYLSREA